VGGEWVVSGRGVGGKWVVGCLSLEWQPFASFFFFKDSVYFFALFLIFFEFPLAGVLSLLFLHRLLKIILFIL